MLSVTPPHDRGGFLLYDDFIHIKLMKYASYYQIAHKETNEILSYMGETKFYSLDKAQEAMSDFENQEISAYESMRKELHTAFKWQSIRPLDSKFVHMCMDHLAASNLQGVLLLLICFF